MFLRLTLLLLALLGLVSCSPKIRHVRVDDAQVVTTGLGVYGLTDPKLAERNWKTISVQGDDVLAVASNCSPTQMKLSSLPESDKTLITEAKRYIFEVQQATDKQSAKLTKSNVLFESDGTPKAPSTTKMQSVKVRGSSIVKLAGDYVSLVQPNMPQNIARVFLTGDVTTFVYEDGKVTMKPSDCLESSEKQLIQQFRTTLQLGEYSMKQTKAASSLTLEEQLKERKERERQRVETQRIKERAKEEYMRNTPRPIVRTRLTD